jgi:F-type H+-transporting ATPase subunit b
VTALFAMLAAEARAPAEGVPLVDWVTIVAQVVNFVVLVVLLRVFLYKPILRAMDKRQETIAAKFNEAETREAEALKERDALREDRETLEAKRDELLDEARRDAHETRRTLRDEARRAVDEQAREWHRALRDQRDSFLGSVRRRAAAGVCDAARRALADLADAALEARAIGVFADRLRDLPDEDRQAFAAAVRDADGPAVVATAWDPGDEGRDKVGVAVREHLGDIELAFETDEALVCGIELRTEGREIAWSVDRYVQGLRDRLDAMIDEAAAQARESPTEQEKEETQEVPEQGEEGAQGEDDSSDEAPHKEEEGEAVEKAPAEAEGRSDDEAAKRRDDKAEQDQADEGEGADG